jgi:hypothetical protein
MLNLFEKISSRSMPRITQTEIVCGDCAGDELLPIRTKLTSANLCAECGGRNYEFASVLVPALAQHLRKEKLQELNNYGTQNQNSKTTGNCIEIGGHFRH